MMTTDFLEASANKKIYSYKSGKYNVVEYIRDISVNAATAQTAYFMSEMNIHKRQLAVNLNDNAVIVLDEFDKSKIRMLGDYLGDNLKNGTVVLINDTEGKLQVLIKTKNQPLDASALLKEVLGKFGGNGGGKKDFAQGSLKDNLSKAQLVEAFKEKI